MANIIIYYLRRIGNITADIWLIHLKKFVFVTKFSHLYMVIFNFVNEQSYTILPNIFAILSCFNN